MWAVTSASIAISWMRRSFWALKAVPTIVRDFYASQVLSTILGGGMSSRLFQEIREKHGLCYSVYAFHWGFSDTGIFGIHAATGKSDIEELVPLLLGELQESGAGHRPGRARPGTCAISRRPHDGA